MSVGAKRHFPDALQQFVKCRVAGKIRAQDQGVDEETDEAFGLEAGAGVTLVVQIFVTSGGRQWAAVRIVREVINVPVQPAVGPLVCSIFTTYTEPYFEVVSTLPPTTL